ncbi:alpha/beta hydrolase family protein [Arenibacter palladensis]|uniref:alpha/beta hydrolase family protein n=1 Tax=Arenibacter palladensis TaxID=237373 RepID=UPI0026E44F4C|nr:acetylxylan esterase [Arenibacter palladensis]MDO6604975.1 acetylxylan esterase [Arenibacter palladensis]
MKLLPYSLSIFFFLSMFIGSSQTNYEESKVPSFDVPDPLLTFSGHTINSVKKWEKVRRPELLRFFENDIYGKLPKKLKINSYAILEEDNNALNGKAKRKQVELTFKKKGKTLSYTILLYLPKNKVKAPIFLGYNFYGNHTITEDKAVIISSAWANNNESFGIENNTLTEASRGKRTHRWAVEKILDAGYGLATIYYGEVDPDKNDFSDGIHPLLYQHGQDQPKPAEWGSIAAWSWGMVRALDYFEKDADIDASKVIAFGHSRLGKTSLWAGATDERFAGVISNNSGCGGAALSKRKFGETIAVINDRFPHWFCDNFNQYDDNEEALPVDQHQLLALIAPRPLYVASAEEDQWADPRGEFLSSHYATQVYHLYGKKGIETKEMPMLNEPIHNTVSYHIRTGKHDVTDYDWENYIKWANAFVK